LFDNRLRDSVRKQLAIFDIARFATFTAIA
jgi:hypothetical protein